MLPTDVDVSPGGIKWQIHAQFFFYFQGFLWIYIRIFPIVIPSPPLNQQNLSSSPPTRNKWAIYSIDNSCWNNISIAFSAGYANVPIFQRIGEMVQNIDIQDGHFINVLRKIFVKGNMHLIYERNLILFHNPLFQAVDARTN